MTGVSFVVPAWNEAEGIGATLSALAAAGMACGRGWEIVVVDNASTDRTAEIARAAGARVVSEPIRQIARARNAGARAASGRLLVFVDADTLASPELVLDALGAMDSGRAVGGSTEVRFLGGSWPARLAAGAWNRISRRLGWGAGCFLFCLREAWEGVGGFDERVYASEDVWFSQALKRWAKPRGLEFRILSGHPPRTSPRKMEGRDLLRSILQFALLAACPWLARSRRACFLWYRR